MGYYTYYSLSCYDEKKQEIDYLNIPSIHDKFVEALHEINPNYFDENENLEVFFSDSMKWYDHHHDIHALSKKFPEYTFVLEGQGEDSEDVWRAYYHNGDGESTRAKLVYERPVSEFAREISELFYDVEEI